MDQIYRAKSAKVHNIILYLYLSPALGLIQGFLLTFFHKTSKVYFF